MKKEIEQNSPLWEDVLATVLYQGGPAGKKTMSLPRHLS